MNSGLIDAVVAGARRSALERSRVTGRDLEEEAATRRPRGDLFKSALASPGVRIVAECKKRSPSRGILRAAYDPAAIARGYEAAGAAAISVLTEPTFFDGDPNHLRTVRASVSVPLLRKDFIVTEFHVLEARACGADAVLLIVAALNDETLTRLLTRAAALGLAALVEVHDADELRRALGAGADIIGVNSRNLRTLAVLGTVFEDLASALPPQVVAVAESGIGSGAEVARLHALRYDAFLIGERFMTAAAPERALTSLLAEARERGAS